MIACDPTVTSRCTRTLDPPNENKMAASIGPTKKAEDSFRLIPIRVMGKVSASSAGHCQYPARDSFQ